jgi:hypothetical protein
VKAKRSWLAVKLGGALSLSGQTSEFFLSSGKGKDTAKSLAEQLGRLHLIRRDC